MAASAPTVVMAPAAAPHVAMTMTMAMTAPHLDDRCIGAAQSIRCCGGHCRRRQGWCQRKSAGGESDQQKPFHVSVSSFELALLRQGRKVPAAVRVPCLKLDHCCFQIGPLSRNRPEPKQAANRGGLTSVFLLAINLPKNPPARASRQIARPSPTGILPRSS